MQIRSLHCRRKFSLHFNDKGAQIMANLRDHPIISAVVIGLFIVYLPIVYQIHLNLIAVHVGTNAGGYFWGNQQYQLFPLPIDVTWISMGYTQAIAPLSPMEEYIYTHFYPSIAPRVMWSVMWLTIGIVYIIWPLLESSKS